MIGRADCKFCRGEGLIQVDDLNSRLCICAYAKRMAEHLGPEIAQAPSIVSSPLYIRGEDGQPPIHDRTKENCYLRGPWPEIVAHLKYVLGLKGLQFKFLITTDEKLRNIWLGHESYKARPREEKESGEVINSLSDVMSDPHLALVRVGFLGYKNVAMPGILKEALMLRQVARLPTWFIEDPDMPFDGNNFSYSFELQSYITNHFKVNLDLTGSVPAALNRTVKMEKVAPVAEAPAMAVEDYEPVVREEPALDLNVDFGNSSKKKPKYTSNWQKKKAAEGRPSDEDFE